MVRSFEGGSNDFHSGRALRILGLLLRWLLVPIVTVALGLAGALLGRWIVSLGDSRCTTENLIGGACVEAWQTGFVEAVIYAVAIVLVLAMTALPAAMAPALKRSVACICGLIVPILVIGAYLRFGWTDFLPLVFVTTASAVVGISLVFFWRRSNATT